MNMNTESYVSPIFPWLTLRIMIPIWLLLTDAAIDWVLRSPISGWPLLLLTLYFLPYIIFTAQVRFSDEGVKYRRWLRWRFLRWSQVESIEVPNYFPTHVLILTLSGHAFPTNRLWYFPKSAHGYFDYRVREHPSFDFARRALQKSRGDFHPAYHEPLNAVTTRVYGFQAILVVVLIMTGWATGIRNSMLQELGNAPESFGAFVARILWSGPWLLLAFFASVLLFILSSRAVRNWKSSNARIVVLCIASSPQVTLLGVGILRVLLGPS